MGIGFFHSILARGLKLLYRYAAKPPLKRHSASKTSQTRLLMDVRFECPHCGQHIAAAPEDAGFTASCPNCSVPITVPHPIAPEPTATPPTPKPAIIAEPRKRGSLFRYILAGCAGAFLLLILLVIVIVVAINSASTSPSNAKASLTASTSEPPKASDRLLAPRTSMTPTVTSEPPEASDPLEGVVLNGSVPMQDGRMAYVIGTVTNHRQAPVRGIRVDVTWLDQTGRYVTSCSGYIGTIYPGQEAPFKAPAPLNAFGLMHHYTTELTSSK